MSEKKVTSANVRIENKKFSEIFSDADVVLFVNRDMNLHTQKISFL